MSITADKPDVPVSSTDLDDLLSKAGGVTLSEFFLKVCEAEEVAKKSATTAAELLESAMRHHQETTLRYQEASKLRQQVTEFIQNFESLVDLDASCTIKVNSTVPYGNR